MREENETFALVARVVYRRNSFAFSESVGALFYLYNFRFLSKSREKTQKFSSKKRATPKEKKAAAEGKIHALFRSRFCAQKKHHHRQR